MKRIAGAVVAMLFGLAAVASAQDAPPVAEPWHGTDKEHVKIMNQMEHTLHQMRGFQRTMQERKAHETFQDMGKAIEQMCTRLGIVEERMDRLSQDPTLTENRARLEALTHARERFRAMITELEGAYGVLRKAVERKAKLGEPTTAEEHARHEKRRQEMAQRMERVTARVQALQGRLKDTADPMELEDLATDLEKIRDRVQAMMNSCGAIHDDADLSRDRDRLREIDPVHDRMDALIALMEAACTGVELASGT